MAILMASMRSTERDEKWKIGYGGRGGGTDRENGVERADAIAGQDWQVEIAPNRRA